MDFLLNKTTGIATSSCGFYTISSALNNGKLWYNAEYLPTHRNLEGSYDKDAAKVACQKHAVRMAAQKANVLGVSS